MGLFDFLRRKPPPPKPAPPSDPKPWEQKPDPTRLAWLAQAAPVAEPEEVDARDFPLPVVGESHYLVAFEAIFGRRTRDGVCATADAQLIPESDNPHDRNAVRVELEGRHVGYLSRDNAVRYRACYGGQVVACRALVRGGWRRGADAGDFGVTLALRLD